jgi:hypothetical protein
MYTPNNIRFRIVSSAAIAQFKQDQAFDFNELINNEAYSFSAEARETLLLNYEVWFKFICRLEKMMIRTLHANDLLGELTLSIDMLARDILTELEDVIQTHPTIFNATSPTTQLIAKAHFPYTNNVFDVISSCREQTMYLAFPRIVNAISNSLHNLLFILHEVENLKKEDGHNFLSMTEEVIEIWNATGVCPLQTRAALYYVTFNAYEFSIKNYSGVPINPECIELLTAVGIVVKSVDALDNFEHSACALPDTHKIAV